MTQERYEWLINKVFQNPEARELLNYLLMSKIKEYPDNEIDAVKTLAVVQYIDWLLGLSADPLDKQAHNVNFNRELE